MKTTTTVATVALLISSGACAAQGYVDHKAVKTYRDRPCTEVVGTIDGQATFDGIGTQGMLWGFLLGYDQAKGGLQGSEETTLIRLRKACAADPSASALSLLESFTQ